MKSVILLIILLTAAVFSQTPNWTNVKETNITVGNYDGVDIFTNRDGNHIIVQQSNILKYYKMNINGLAGSPITIESSAVVSPSIAGDATNIYIVYRKSNENFIRTKYSSDGGSNWSYISTLNYNANSVESVFSNNKLHITFEVSNVIYYSRYVIGQGWTIPSEVSTTGQNGNTPRIAAYNYSGNDFVYFMYRKSNSDECKWRKYDVTQNSWGTLYTGFSISGIDYYSGFRVDGSNIVIYFIWHEPDPWQYYFAWVVLDLNNNFIRYGNADLSIINWRMYSTQTEDGRTHTAFYYVQYAGEGGYSDIGLWRSNDGAAYPSDEFLEYEDHEEVRHLNLASAGNEVHVIWKDQYGNNYGNNLRYKYDDQIPIAPQNLTVTKSANNHPLLSWAANKEPDIDYYQLYRWDSYGGGWQPLSQTSNISYEDATLTYCTAIPPQQCPDLRSFQFKVTAVDVSSHESDPSNIVESRLVGGPPSKAGADDPDVNTVLEYSLAQNYPNPFNPTTTINYSLKSAGLVTLKVFDMLGKEVANLVRETKESGNYSITFNASNLPSGIYIYRLTANDFISTKKLMLVK